MRNVPKLEIFAVISTFEMRECEDFEQQEQQAAAAANNA